MGLSKLSILALGAATVIASAVATVALDRQGLIALFPAPQPTRATLVAPIAAPILEPADRFAFVPFDAVLHLLPPPLVELPRLATPPTSWVAETHPEAPAPELKPAVAPETSTRLSAWSQDDGPRSLPRRVPFPRSHARTPALTKRLAEISPAAMRRLVARFSAAKAAWPPVEIALVAIKDEKTVELYGRPQDGPWQFVHRYPVLAASGGAGPKLRQGDKQVPEGIYGISFLNPHSRYHVSLRVNYPNAFDRKMAAADGRSGDLGGDIMVHGKAVSAGCLAVGDPAAEELFVLADHVGTRNVQVVIAPTDFRLRPIPTFDDTKPKWLPKLYAEVAANMADFKAPTRQVLSAPMDISAFFGN